MSGHELKAPTLKLSGSSEGFLLGLWTEMQPREPWSNIDQLAHLKTQWHSCCALMDHFCLDGGLKRPEHEVEPWTQTLSCSWDLERKTAWFCSQSFRNQDFFVLLHFQAFAVRKLLVWILPMFSKWDPGLGTTGLLDHPDTDYWRTSLPVYVWTLFQHMKINKGELVPVGAVNWVQNI